MWYVHRQGGVPIETINGWSFDFLLTYCADLDWYGDRQVYDRGPVMPPEPRR